MDVKLAAVLGVLFISACAHPRVSVLPERELPGSDGRAHPLVSQDASYTVIEFFSAHCPCQTAHDARLRALVETYAPRGVAFYAVDSEIGASPARDHEEAQKRGYSYPILVDANGDVARALAAEYATYTVIVDRAGQVVYAGGIDSDKNHLTSSPTLHLANALDDLLAGRPLRARETKTLGCALEKS
jgi:peroxiredoxin